jgi:cytochrome c biogenesis protein CcmG, thiol:disulfide interchange protein DsbE
VPELYPRPGAQPRGRSNLSAVGNRSFTAVLGAVALIALLAFGLVSRGADAVAIGELAPDAPVERLGAEGTASLADYRGEWVLVNFWASWCEPCRVEAPAIERYAGRHRDELLVVGMNTEDLTRDAIEFIESLEDEEDRPVELSWEMLRDGDGNRKNAFGVLALPETFLIDPEGRIALIRHGVVDEEYLEQHVTPLISGEGAA